MATRPAEIVRLAVLDQGSLTVTVRRGQDETSYRFSRIPSEPVAAIDYEWRFQHDFMDQYEAFRMILDTARRALGGELPSLPLPLPSDQDPAAAR
jgi:hypothetical protein